MNKDQLTKLDDLRDRLLQEYTTNGETDDYKKIMKKVIEIGSRMVHSTLTDISDVPKIGVNFDKMIEQMESIKVAVRAMEIKLEDGLNHRVMNESCKMHTEKIIYNILKAERTKTKESISFGIEIIRFLVYVAPIMAVILWAAANIKVHG